MKYTTILTIFLLCSVCCGFGAYIKPDIEASDRANKISSQFDLSSQNGKDDRAERTQNQRAIKSPTTVSPAPLSSLNASQLGHNQTVLSQATVNLVQKVLSNLRNRPLTTIPDKQFLGGKLPSFLERIVQRIQNYFSVYNPPEYFEGNRPPASSNAGIAVVCSNVQTEDLSCDPVPAEEYGVVQQECENIVSQLQQQQPQNGDPAAGEDGYNIVVTHTVVHDNMINVYSPAESGTSQVVSNVVVILEPSAAEYTPPSPPQQGLIRNKDKFYVYVNPTAANKKKDQFQTKAEQPETFQPYDNATYTVIIKGHQLHEFSNNIENTDNGKLHPEISPYIPPNLAHAEEAMLTSRSVTEGSNNNNKELPDVPNINLVLVPPHYQQRNKSSCVKDKYENDGHLEYYILKPDSGNIIKPHKKPGNVGHKITEIDVTSGTYLPPLQQQSSEPTNQPAEATSVVNVQPSTSKFPLLFNLFKKKPEEPRAV